MTQHVTDDSFESDVLKSQGPVLVDFWASWCVPCKLEAQDLENVWQEYADQNVIFLGINYLDTPPKAFEHMKEFAITYPNAPDLRSAISGKYEVVQVPETFIVDEQGIVQQIIPGIVEEAQLIHMIEELVTK